MMAVNGDKFRYDDLSSIISGKYLSVRSFILPNLIQEVFITLFMVGQLTLDHCLLSSCGSIFVDASCPLYLQIALIGDISILYSTAMLCVIGMSGVLCCLDLTHSIRLPCWCGHKNASSPFSVPKMQQSITD
jgi:hypothetical protein